MFPNQVKEQFSWFYWVFAASFYIMGMLIFFLLTFFFLCRKDKNLICIKDTATNQLKVLGKLSFLEKGAILGVLLLIFGIITEQIHQIPISWIALGILSLLLYLGILSNKSFQNKIPWPLILSLGIFISILKTLKYLEADDLLTTQINFLAGFMDGNIFIFISAFP